MSGKKKNIMMIVLLFALLLGLTVPAWAQSKTGTKTIRVAYREDADFINKSGSGVYKGYGVEYLNQGFFSQSLGRLQVRNFNIVMKF